LLRGCHTRKTSHCCCSNSPALLVNPNAPVSKGCICTPSHAPKDLGNRTAPHDCKSVIDTTPGIGAKVCQVHLALKRSLNSNCSLLLVPGSALPLPMTQLPHMRAQQQQRDRWRRAPRAQALARTQARTQARTHSSPHLAKEPGDYSSGSIGLRSMGVFVSQEGSHPVPTENRLHTSCLLLQHLLVLPGLC
jgi:hypothetical protein